MRKGRRQCAALPFKEIGGETWVMLITSRETGRWILPKGWAEKRLSNAELAAKEAYEEAGIIGDVSTRSIHRYRYAKRLPTMTVDCTVDVYPLRVTTLLTTWPEAHQRRREWFTLGQAALLIDDTELVTTLLGLATPSALSKHMGGQAVPAQVAKPAGGNPLGTVEPARVRRVDVGHAVSGMRPAES